MSDAAPRSLQPDVRRMILGSLALLVVFLAAWQWAPAWFGIPPFIIPSVSLVWDEFLQLALRLARRP